MAKGKRVNTSSHVNTSKRVNRSKSASAKQQRKAANDPKPVESKARSSKQVEVIGLLSRQQGLTIAAIMKITGWQQHSVRGFLAGVVRKKFGLKLESEKKEGADRVYRIVEDKAGKPNRKANAEREAA